MLRSLLRVTNRRVRYLVGLLLAALFCVQCTSSTNARPDAMGVTSVNGRLVGAQSTDVMGHIEHLAKTDHAALLEYCLKNYDSKYHDYTCTFSKQERIGGRLGGTQTMHVKFRGDPFSVVMAWFGENIPKGEKLIYVEGKYNDQMLIKPNLPFAGMLTVTRPLAAAKQYSLRTPDQFGFKRSMENLLEVYRAAKARGDLRESFGGYAKFGRDDEPKRDALVLVRYLPATASYPAAKTVIYIDLQYLVPVGIEAYSDANAAADDAKTLIARYSSSDLKFNVGLEDKDFLPESNGMAAVRQ